MNQNQIAVVELCSKASFDGSLAFPAIVGKLHEAGVERYHADYCRAEKTFYLPDGSSHVVKMPLESKGIGAEFDARAVEAAVRQSQRNEHTYFDFVRKTMAAGCVGYFVQITGRQAQYFGRKGEMHVEPFPTGRKP